MTGPEAPTLFDPTPNDLSDLRPTSRVRMLVAYHGAPSHGFAVNAGVRKVGGVLTGAIGKVLGLPVVLTVAGLTDKGLHAWGYVVSFAARREGLDLPGLQLSLNRMLQPHV